VSATLPFKWEVLGERGGETRRIGGMSVDWQRKETSRWDRKEANRKRKGGGGVTRGERGKKENENVRGGSQHMVILGNVSRGWCVKGNQVATKEGTGSGGLKMGKRGVPPRVKSTRKNSYSEVRE